MWYIGPFEATSEVGLPLRVENRWSLPEGTTYAVYAAGDPYDPGWFSSGSLTVSSDGRHLEGEASLPLLTAVVLVDEAAE